MGEKDYVSRQVAKGAGEEYELGLRGRDIDAIIHLLRANYLMTQAVHEALLKRP
jgi:hypothetical protein